MMSLEWIGLDYLLFPKTIIYLRSRVNYRVTNEIEEISLKKIYGYFWLKKK